jgi:hypothetical protein
MTKRDPVTGLTDAELAKLAEDAYEQRDDRDAWEDEERPEVSADVRSVVSVRFNQGAARRRRNSSRAAGPFGEARRLHGMRVLMSCDSPCEETRSQTIRPMRR